MSPKPASLLGGESGVLERSEVRTEEIPRTVMERTHLPPDHFVLVGMVKTRYVMAGQGSPVILLHGLSGSLRFWYPNIEPLAQRHQVYALDMVGFGFTDKPQVEYSLPYAVTFIRDFMDALGITAASLVGTSAGGLLAATVALQHPEQVSGLVLVDSGGLGPNLGLSLRLLSLPLIGEFLCQPSRWKARTMLRGLFYNPDLLEEELVEELFQVQCLPGAKQALLAAIRSGIGWWGQRPEINLLDRLSQLKVPALIIWGADDALLPLSHGIEAHRRIPNSRLHVVAECGHCPHLERPNEFNSTVLEFLEGVDLESISRDRS